LEIEMNVVQPTRGEKGATPIGLDADPNGLGNKTVAMSSQVTSVSPAISFPVGYHDLRSATASWE
jgi:hypothetical protein